MERIGKRKENAKESEKVRQRERDSKRERQFYLKEPENERDQLKFLNFKDKKERMEGRKKF